VIADVDVNEGMVLASSPAIVPYGYRPPDGLERHQERRRDRDRRLDR
jgi:hypothetical protein